MHLSTLLLFFYAILSPISGHPSSHNHLDPKDTLVRREFLHNAKRAIARCRSTLDDSVTSKDATRRRGELARTLRATHGLPLDIPRDKRDFGTVLHTNHTSNRTGLSSHPEDEDLFSGHIACILQPEVTVGPYWVEGEMLRSDIAENQKGVPLYLEFQIIDTTTCKPLSGAYVDIWHANATGVYSGVVAYNNGNRKDTANAYRTHNRGIQQTDSDGVVHFKTIFPGHYTGRTHHIHLITTTGATRTPSDALAGGHISHVGQVFFDQGLANAVEGTAPYVANAQRRTPNQDDDIMQEASAEVDPVVRYVWLGSAPADGVLAWMAIGVDPRAEYAPRAAAMVGGGRYGGARPGGFGGFGV